jgi:hypothetical protein
MKVDNNESAIENVYAWLNKKVRLLKNLELDITKNQMRLLENLFSK